MTDIRAFIAIELPQEVKLHLKQVHQQFIDRRIRCVRWVAVNNIHLTLQFLGDTPAAKLDSLEQDLKPVIAAQNSFSVQALGIGAFPNTRHPRVIWAGLRTPADLATLQNLVTKTVDKAGLPVEDSGFSPHLTLGRVKRDTSPGEMHEVTTALEEINVGLLGTIPVNTVILFRSDLRPEGPIYTPLAQFPLLG